MCQENAFTVASLHFEHDIANKTLQGCKNNVTFVAPKILKDPNASINSILTVQHQQNAVTPKMEDSSLFVYKNKQW